QRSLRFHARIGWFRSNRRSRRRQRDQTFLSRAHFAVNCYKSSGHRDSLPSRSLGAIGAITLEVGSSLLQKLNAAVAYRAKRDCKDASATYQAFINELRA